MSDFTMTIDGKAVAGSSRFGVMVFAEAPEASRAQLDAAMESARAAFAGSPR